MKKVIEGFITYAPSAYGSEEKFDFFPFEMKVSGHITIMPYSFEVDIPDDFDPRAKQVEALKAEKKKLMADFQVRCTEIERKISELTALTCEAV